VTRDATEISENAAAVSQIAERLALAFPVEGAGVVAAGVLELASALTESIARASLDSWTEARGAAIQAATLRARAHQAGIANARAYAAARAALARQPQQGVTGRDAALLAALVAAADTLLAIATTGADVAGLAAEVAARCEPALRADAAACTELAVSAVRSAATLVDINLALLPGDQRREQVRSIATAAESARSRALASVE
jgi:formiminotetrahydrofolate cyclodeaminase